MLIDLLHARARGQAFAEVLAEVETEPDDLTWLRLSSALRAVPG